MSVPLVVVLAILACAAPEPLLCATHGGENRAGTMHLAYDPELDRAFSLMYELRFTQAREELTDWERRHPADPMGPSLEAAAFLYEEFNEKGVLTSEFFLDDKRLLGGIQGQPDANLENGFHDAIGRAEQEAHRRLKAEPRDISALFALTLADGLQADDDSLIEKHPMQSMHFLRKAESEAKLLLQMAPDSDDAYLAIGAANYIVGCLPGYKRAILWLGHIHGDKALGMQQLARVAAQGHYLQPYGKLMLGLTALREKQVPLARQQFRELADQFPQNPLFARELAKLPPETALTSGR